MRKHLPLLFLSLGAVGFLLAVLQLFRFRFESGDIYPAYSSLRADPLGTMVLCESLQKLPGLSVRRDFNAAGRLPDGKNTTYLHLAARGDEWRWMTESVLKECERFAAGGGRLVVTFLPETSRPSQLPDVNQRFVPPGTGREPKPKQQPVEPPAKKKEGERLDEETGLQLVSLKERWGVEFGFLALAKGEGATYQPAQVANQTDLPLPATLGWHTGLIFTNVAPTWQPIYARRDHPVVLQRSFGSGALVLMTDSYFLSNEAMVKERHPDLLTWVIGNGRAVIFDEAHFGIVEEQGVTTLMRRYHLEPVVAAFLLLAGLFIWKYSSSLLPPVADLRAQGPVPGKDTAAGFINLLRRNIPPADLLGLCFAEWKKTFGEAGQPTSARVPQVQALLNLEKVAPVRQRDPVGTYQKICRALKVPTQL